MRLFLLLSSISGLVAAFAPSPSLAVQRGCHGVSLLRMTQGSDEEASMMDRRDLFTKTAAVATSFGMSFLLPLESTAAESTGIGTDPEHPIVIIGASGKCGKLCTEILKGKNLYSRAVTRSGRTILSEDSPYVTYAPGDVTNFESIKEAVKGASGVIFAASASGKKKGGDPAHVDYLGVYNTAKACLECEVPKLVVISAGTVTRPNSAGFKATNFFVKYVYGDKIMDYKIAGEAIMRDLYAASPNSPPLSYAVVRPGGLSDKPSKGPGIVHVSQGDVYSSEVTREDVAQVTVAALLKGSGTDFATFELNQIEGLGKADPNLPDLPKKLVHAGGSTYSSLLDGLLTDEEMKKSLPQVVSDFRGDNIESINAIG